MKELFLIEDFLPDCIIKRDFLMDYNSNSCYKIHDAYKLTKNIKKLKEIKKRSKLSPGAKNRSYIAP